MITFLFSVTLLKDLASHLLSYSLQLSTTSIIPFLSSPHVWSPWSRTHLHKQRCWRCFDSPLQIPEKVGRWRRWREKKSKPLSWNEYYRTPIWGKKVLRLVKGNFVHIISVESAGSRQGSAESKCFVKISAYLRPIFSRGHESGRIVEGPSWVLNESYVLLAH